MDETIQVFIDELEKRQGYSNHTVAAYRVDLTQFHRFLVLRQTQSWGRVDKSILLEYVLHLRGQNYAPASVSRKVAALKTFFGFLAGRGQLRANPAAELDTPRFTRGEPRYLAGAELERLLASPPDDGSPKNLRDRAMLAILAATGMRVSELVSLDLEDVDWGTCALRCLRSGSGGRTLPLNERAWQALEAYVRQARPLLVGQDSASALFVNLQGERLTRQGLWLVLRRYARQAGIQVPVTPHTLRNSIALQLFREGRGIQEVQEWLGHSHKTSTMRYASARPIGATSGPGESTRAPSESEKDGHRLYPEPSRRE